MKKLQLSALKLGANEILTRTQMKNVLGGSGSGSGSGTNNGCKISGCTLFVAELNHSVPGNCAGQSIPNQLTKCWCASIDGKYQTNNGGTTCYA